MQGGMGVIIWAACFVSSIALVSHGLSIDSLFWFVFHISCGCFLFWCAVVKIMQRNFKVVINVRVQHDSMD